ncbi:MAG: ZIP family metal transporter [Lachnospiraceae bacterium]|nr:ZIP family metal transporter [Lachnospiraceae bacterium]
MSYAIGILIPLIGTTLGSACVFLLKNKIRENTQKGLLGFAAGVMVAAAVWSLIIPALEMEEDMGRFAFVPTLVGILLGMTLLLVLDHVVPHLHLESDTPEGIKAQLSKSTMMILAVTIHNIPEGMAVGIVFAGLISESTSITLAGAMALSIGIAIQNFPEGAIISMPLRAAGLTRRKAFVYGMLSGVVEPVAAFITILLTNILLPVIPYLLSLAAGAMLYVVVEELIPEASVGEHSNIGSIGFMIGFVIMMVLDVALG